MASVLDSVLRNGLLLKFRGIVKYVFRFWFIAEPFGSEGALAGRYMRENLVTPGAKKFGFHLIVSLAVNAFLPLY